MTNKLTRIYWDSTVFLCFLNKQENDRRKICEDVLYHARDGKIDLYTSTFTMAEVVRPLNKDVNEARQLSPDETAEIQKMFQWPWVRRIDVDHRVVRKAVELARDFALSAADAIHAASAIVAHADVLQHWERKSGFGALSRMIAVENPRRLSYSDLHVVAAERISLRTANPASVPGAQSGPLLRRAVRL